MEVPRAMETPARSTLEWESVEVILKDGSLEGGWELVLQKVGGRAFFAEGTACTKPWNGGGMHGHGLQDGVAFQLWF